MDTAASKLNHIMAMAGIGVPVDSVCVIADESRLVFRTFWNCESDTLSEDRHLIDIKLGDSTQHGSILEINQDGTLIEPLGYILYIEDVAFNYYDKNDNQTTTPANVMSAEILLTFRRDSPWRQDQPLRTNIQLKCFFMNSYLQGA
ncbi:MAG: hypothetical protein PHU99_09715 [Candidatus Cloacimonetes bacterium]|nr:hypothetical protein [Candidatus Cloacimonadota bacterium]